MDTLDKNEQLTEIIYSIVYQHNCDRGVTVRIELPEFMKKHREEKRKRKQLGEERAERRMRRWAMEEEREREREMRKKFSND